MRLDLGLLCDLKGIVGSVEVPPAAVYMRPHQEGSVIRGQVWESPLLVSGLSCDSGQPKTLFHLMRSSLCMCVVGAQREKIRILTAVLQLSRLTSKDLLCPRKSIEEEEEERTGVRHGSFSGKVISSVDSQSVLPELPFSGLANRVRLWSILSDSYTRTLTWGLPSGPVLST